MVPFRCWVKGYLHIKVAGLKPERFLTLCLYHNILLRNICYETEVSFDVLTSEYSKIKELAEKCGCRIKTEKKAGLPFWIRRNKKNTPFVVGAVLFVLLIHGMTGYIWNITITGNEIYSTDMLQEFLFQEGIRTGMSVQLISCDEIEQLLRNEYERISWVSAKIEGSRCVIELRESKLPSFEKNDESGDIVADVSGIVKDMLVRNGIPMVKVGDEVEKGKVLVSGRIPIVDDSGTEISSHLVSADADITIEHTIEYRDSFPDFKQSYILEEEKSYPWILAGKCLFEWPFMPKNEESAREVRVFREHRQLCLFGDYYLPVYTGLVRYCYYHKEKISMTEEECLYEANRRFYEFLEREHEDASVSEGTCEISRKGERCYVSGKIRIVEKAGEKVLMAEGEDEEKETKTDEE